MLATVSERADGPCYREWSAPAEAGSYRHYVTVHGLESGAVADVFEDREKVESVSHVGSSGDGAVLEVVTGDSPVRRLLEVGASTTRVVAEDGELTVVAEIPGELDTRSIVEAAGEMYDTELVSKRTLDRPVHTADEFHDPVAGRPTERQQAALKHAYFNGYYSWPRDATAEEIADAMDVSSPTLHYHLRRAERALVDAYL
jgi:predicted DNA binding protein